MRRTDVLVIGGGQAGLAASYCLAARGIDHVVLERGRVAQRWRTATWDALYLQTPRWQSRLPGWQYSGADPDGFMPVAELVGFLERYALSFAAPVHEGVRVHGVSPLDGGYRVETDDGTWAARAVIVATGQCDVPAIPELAAGLSPRVHQLATPAYRRPEALPPGGVLVVGASASGVLIADELRRAGREVTLAVGNHTRVPRRHRGRDIYWWLDAMGVLQQAADDVRDLAAARRQPSMQLAGGPAPHPVDLRALHAAGARVAGRLTSIDNECVTFADDLSSTTGAADARARSLLTRIDAFAVAHQLPACGPAADVTPLAVSSPPRHLHLADERIGTVIWATGFQRDYRWLHVPGTVVGGELVHVGGITPAAGLYALGLRFMRHRNSNFLDGVGADARDIVEHLANRLDRRDAA